MCQKTNISWPSLSHSTDLAMAKVELSQEQVEELRQAFDMFDRDKGGSISTRELGYTMRAMGMNPTEAEILDLLCEFDSDNNGTIEFEEFCLMMSGKMLVRLSWTVCVTNNEIT